jgi:WD40 repeat protein
MANFVARVFFAFIFLITSTSAYSQCNEEEILNLRRTAIVLGEKNYVHAPALFNPENDAQDISDSLKRLGFDVATYFNTDLKTMNVAIDNWCAGLKEYDVALFYYSGHGAEYNGENYLFPIDANPKGPSDLAYCTISANQILGRLDEYKRKFNIVILDACRNNPFTRSWSRNLNSKGLAQMSGNGSFIGFAASPGNTALDGDLRNGIYTEAILKNITVPDLTIDQIFTRVNSYVRNRTDGQQIPFKNSSLSVDFCFSVRHKEAISLDIKSNGYIQPNSNMVLVLTENKLIIGDSLNGGIDMIDLSVPNVTSKIVSSTINRPSKITIGGSNYIYAIDQKKQSLLILDLKQQTIYKEVALKGTPNSIAVTRDDSKAYVGLIENSSASICIIDLIKGNIKKKIPTKGKISDICLAPDNKRLYVAQKGELIVIATKNDNIEKIYTNAMYGGIIAITPNNKCLVTTGVEDNYIRLIDLGSRKIIDSLQFKANLFAFTDDGKYLIASGNSEILVVRLDKFEVTNSLPFVTLPLGIAVSKDRAFVSLPYEKRVFMMELNSFLENSENINPEIKYNKFKARLQDQYEHDSYYVRSRIADDISKALGRAVDGMVSELGVMYRHRGGWCDTNSTTFYCCQFGIESVRDEKISLRPVFKGVIDEESIFITITDDDGKSETFKTSYNTPDWNSLVTFTRKYFIKRIDKLK